MSNTLKILLPTTFPTAMSVLSFNAVLTLTAISGELVPKATTVSPITNGEMPTAAAKREAPRTRISAPAIKKAKPNTINKIVCVFM
jgi:hypothetical protein